MTPNHTIIIAEAGVNHNGSLDMAVKMIHAAANAGADYVKFQTFKAESLVAASAPKAEYQLKNCSDCESSQLSMLRKLQLCEADFLKLISECQRCKIGFMSTPFDIASIEFLDNVEMDYWKIPSGEITNLPYLRRIAQSGKRVILSTGMSTLDEVNSAIDVLNEYGTPKDKIFLLHCTTQYPTPYKDVNLRAMDSLRKLGCRGVGYSDHTPGITVPVAAVALGAEIIEKHFTLDRNLPGPDHKASLTPVELEQMVVAIRHTELSLGDGYKTVTESERPNINVARKSIVASRHINIGETFDETNITTKRPGSGVSPMLWDKVLGTNSKRTYEPDDMIELENKTS